MRKFLYSILSLVLVLAFLLGGCDCSCSSTQPLAFNSKTFGESTTVTDVRPGYSETLVYDVKLSENYNSMFTKNSALSEKIVKYDYSGTLTTKLESYSVGVLASLGIKSNIPNNLPDTEKTIYKFTSDLQVDATYEFIKGNTSEKETFKDTVYSEIYFCSAKMSFAPIYSKTERANRVLVYSQNSVGLNNIYTETVTTYNTQAYTINSIIKNNEGEVASSEKNTYEYDFRTVIDNAQLLFVLRNFNVTSDANYLPTISSAYGESEELSVVSNKKITTTLKNLKYNDNPAQDEEIQIKDISFKLAKSFNSGLPQIVQIQQAKSTSGNVLNNALLTTYVQPLMAYGSLYIMGSLVCTLSSVNIVVPPQI